MIVTCSFLKTFNPYAPNYYRKSPISFRQRNDNHDDKNMMMGWKSTFLMKMVHFWNYMITYIISAEVIMGTNILKSLNYFTKGPNERSSGDVLVGTLFSFYDKHCSQSVSPYRLQITCFYIMWFGRTLLSRPWYYHESNTPYDMGHIIWSSIFIRLSRPVKSLVTVHFDPEIANILPINQTGHESK